MPRNKKLTKEQIMAMNRAQLKAEAVKIITGSILPLLEICIEQRVSQWFDVIVEKLEEKKA